MIIITFPDLGNLIPETWTVNFSGKEMPTTWVAWLALVQLSMAALCVLAWRGPRAYGTGTVLAAVVLWYFVQAVDEVVDGNFFGAGLWEYPVLVLWLWAVVIYLQRHEHKETPY